MNSQRFFLIRYTRRQSNNQGRKSKRVVGTVDKTVYFETYQMICNTFAGFVNPIELM